MRFSAALERAWYQPKSWSRLLLPLSWLFQFVAERRRNRQQGASAAVSLPVPVVVVGNISVGGTGKTPLLATLVRHLALQGYRPGIISRGYGGNSPHYPVMVTTESSAEQVGDEPLLLASFCPVVVDPNRLRAAQYLLQQTDCDLILSDDGLQHYRLPRDIELVVVDGERGFGNGLCLPAGPLREPVTRLHEVDFVLVNETAAKLDLPGSEGFEVRATGLRHLASGTSIAADQWQGERQVHAVAGIGNPGRFAHSLRLLGLEPLLHPYPDHHQFTGAELLFTDDLPVIITAKDAVKCASPVPDNVWVLDVTAEVSPRFLARLDERVASLANKARMA